MTDLWLIRHGQTDWNLEGRCQGHADIPLNETGLAQAAALAAQLNEQTFTAIYSSDLLRTRQTADALAKHTGLPVQLDPRLREIHQGEWEGRLIHEVVLTQPEARLNALMNPDIPRAPGGESINQVTERVTAAAKDIVSRHPQEAVLVVSHGLSIAALICHFENIPILSIYSLIPDNAVPRIVQWPPLKR